MGRYLGRGTLEYLQSTTCGRFTSIQFEKGPEKLPNSSFAARLDFFLATSPDPYFIALAQKGVRVTRTKQYQKTDLDEKVS